MVKAKISASKSIKFKQIEAYELSILRVVTVKQHDGFKMNVKSQASLPNIL